MKQIAILEYTMLFDPSETWSSGYQFEKLFADFYAYYGFEAQIVEAKGGTGRRVIYIQRANTSNQVAQALQRETKTTPATNQIKAVQQRTPPKDFKRFQRPKQSQNIPPRQQFQQPGETNRKRVRY